MLFESSGKPLQEKGLRTEDGAAEPDDGDYLTLTIQNCSVCTVHLRKGEVLGTLHQAELVDTWAYPKGVEVKSIGVQGTREAIETEPWKGEGMTIPAKVEKSLESLPEAESAQLRTLLSRYPDLFAQDDLDLGSNQAATSMDPFCLAGEGGGNGQQHAQTRSHPDLKEPLG